MAKKGVKKGGKKIGSASAGKPPKIGTAKQAPKM